MVYKIYYYNEKREKVEFKTITETEYLDIKQMMSEVLLMMSEIDYYLMLNDNAKELAEDINKGKRDENKFNDLNRKLMNLLNSFYAWVEFYQHNYKDVFNALKSNYYDTYFEYRLAYSLRKYTTHCSVCISKIVFDVLKEEEHIYIDPELLLENKDYFNSIVKNDLAELVKSNTKIELPVFLSRFVLVLEKMQKEIWDTTIITNTKIMKTILLNTQPRQDVIMDTVIESEDNSVRTRIGYILMKANDKVLMVIQPAIK